MVFNKNFVLSVFSILCLFAVVLYQLNGFLLSYCACSHLAPATSAMLASMCEYWSCPLQSKLSQPPRYPGAERSHGWVVPVNPGSPSEISRPHELSRFHVNGQAFKTEKHVRMSTCIWMIKNENIYDDKTMDSPWQFPCHSHQTTETTN